MPCAECQPLGLLRDPQARSGPAAVCKASVQLKTAFAASGGAYGSRRLIRQHGLRSAWKRKLVHTTGSKRALPNSPNVLNRQFNPTGPNQAGVADRIDRALGSRQPARTQLVVATLLCLDERSSSLNASAGVRQPSVLRGLVFNARATAFSSLIL